MKVLLWLHILGAAAWFGASLTLVFGGNTFATEESSARAAWYRMMERSGKLLISPAAILILVTGILLVTNGSYGFDAMFVSIGFLIVIVGSGLGMGFFGPKSREAAAALTNGDTATADSIIAKIRSVGILDLALLMFAVAAMVWKWGA